MSAGIGIRTIFFGGCLCIFSMSYASGIGDLSARLDHLEKRMEGRSPAGEAFATEQGVVDIEQRLSTLEVRVMQLVSQVNALLERKPLEIVEKKQVTRLQDQKPESSLSEKSSKISSVSDEEFQALEVPARDLSTPASFPTDDFGNDPDLSAIIQELSDKDLPQETKHVSDVEQKAPVKIVTPEKQKNRKQSQPTQSQKTSQAIAQEIISSKDISPEERGKKLALLAAALKREGKRDQLEKILKSKDFPQDQIAQYKG